MSFAQPDTGLTVTTPDVDPWTWGVEDVVAHICNPAHPVLAAVQPRNRPDLVTLEKALRDNDVDGAVLLSNVDLGTVRSYLGIRSLGHGSTITRMIESFQITSPGYLEYKQQRAIAALASPMISRPSQFTDSSSRTTDGNFHHSTPAAVRSQDRVMSSQLPFDNFMQKKSVEISSETHTDLALSSYVTNQTGTCSDQDLGSNAESNMYPRTEAYRDALQDPPTTNDTLSREGESHVVDKSGRKRRRLDLTLANNAASFQAGQSSSHLANADNAQPFGVAQPGAPQPSCVGEEDMSMTRTHCPLIPKPTEEPLSSAAGIITRDSTGRKRLTPFNIHTPRDQIESLRKVPLNARQSRRKAQDEYLGIHALPIDDMIYDISTEGNEMNREFSVNKYRDLVIISNERYPEGTSHATGKRIYANKRMQYFFQSIHTETTSKAGERVWTLLPYPDRLGRKYQKLSMTKLTLARNDVKVERVYRSQLAQTSDRTLYGDDNNAFDLPGVPLSEQGQALNWDLLEKWKYVAGNDEIQPLYGDSGSENEYSLDHWREIEEEQGETMERTKSVSRRPLLSDSEVNVIIDNSIEGYIAQWHLSQKPRLELRRWRLWQVAKRDGTTQDQILDASRIEQRMAGRLASQRDKICCEQWRKTSDVAKGCRNMQPTIDEREKARWTSAVLREGHSPCRPPRLEKTRRPVTAKESSFQQPLASGEEDLESHQDESSYDSEGSLADFIESDSTEILADIKNRSLDTTRVGSNADEDHSGPGDQLSRLVHTIPASQPPSEPLRVPSMPSERTSRVIDLTQPLDPQEPSATLDYAPEALLLTPPVHGGSESDDPFKRPTFSTFTLPSITSEVIELSSDTDVSAPLPSLSRNLPPLDDAIAISKIDPKILAELNDRRRLLIHHVHKTPEHIRNQMMTMRQFGADDMWKIVVKALTGLKGGRQRLRGYSDLESTALLRIASLYVSWTIPVAINKSGLAVKHINETLAEEKQGFRDFHDRTLSCLKTYEPLSIEPAVKSINSDFKPTPPRSQQRKKKRVPTDDDIEMNGGQHPTPPKKRKYLVPESVETLEMRALAQKRVKEGDQRKALMQYRLGKLSVNEGLAAKVLVNVSKENHQEDIYLNAAIGRVIQPHQQEGLQFMWRELTTDHEHPQGCLLAQTMGLGKTMQVVSVLVTIAEASKSMSSNIRDQVPRSLRESRTLVLCPPALIDNWYEEFLMWSPSPHVDNVGEVRKVNSTMKVRERHAEIWAWKEEGGVLILGYNGFREMVKDSKTAAAPSKDNAEVAKILLELPNVVVADEAHFFKNRESAASKTVNEIKCKRRIALTGSPLSNNLNEYFALMDWVAPGYLGNFTEFKANFTEPIEAGLYADSNEADYRNSRKRLRALQSDLEPKVHRADASVLNTRLRGKTEFVIVVPLTAFQEKIYQGFIGSTYGVPGKHKDNEAENATLWAWMSLLRLLCNHPCSFARQLQGMRSTSRSYEGKACNNEETRTVSCRDTLSTGDERDLLDSQPPRGAISDETLEQQLALFQDLPTCIDDVILSHKMQILHSILSLSQKIGDKCLVFTQSIPSLDYIEDLIKRSRISYCRIDGKTGVGKRQMICKAFNNGPLNICIISTKAGGQGLNMFGANRVIIVDRGFNPTWEEQAIGRAYRIGQAKPVFVYHLLVGGTFEAGIYKQAIFKTQLATRVVDKKNPSRYVERGVGQYLHPPKPVEQKDLSRLGGIDPHVMDRILKDDSIKPFIRSVDLTDSFHREENIQLTPEDELEALQMQKHLHHCRTDRGSSRSAAAGNSSSQIFPSSEPRKHPITSAGRIPSVDKQRCPAMNDSSSDQPTFSGTEISSLPSRATPSYLVTQAPSTAARSSIPHQSGLAHEFEQSKPDTAGNILLELENPPLLNPSIPSKAALAAPSAKSQQLALQLAPEESAPIATGHVTVGC